MATSSISLHQKKLEFEDNQFLSSLFGYHDKNLKVLEDKFKVKLCLDLRIYDIQI